MESAGVNGAGIDAKRSEETVTPCQESRKKGLKQSLHTGMKMPRKAEAECCFPWGNLFNPNPELCPSQTPLWLPLLAAVFCCNHLRLPQYNLNGSCHAESVKHGRSPFPSIFSSPDSTQSDEEDMAT